MITNDMQLRGQADMMAATHALGEVWRAASFNPHTSENYALIANNPAALLYWQDALDSFFSRRMIDIRNALRGLGWDAQRYQWPLRMTRDGQFFRITAECEHVGAGRNVAAVFWRVRDGVGELLHGQADLLTATAEDFAAMLDHAAHAPREFTIQRDHEGTRAQALPGKTLGDETHKTFIYALGKFSHLIEMGEKITLEDWRGRIAKHCAPSDRIAVVLKAIDAARGLKPEGAKHG